MHFSVLSTLVSWLFKTLLLQFNLKYWNTRKLEICNAIIACCWHHTLLISCSHACIFFELTAVKWGCWGCLWDVSIIGRGRFITYLLFDFFPLFIHQRHHLKLNKRITRQWRHCFIIFLRFNNSLNISKWPPPSCSYGKTLSNRRWSTWKKISKLIYIKVKKKGEFGSHFNLKKGNHFIPQPQTWLLQILQFKWEGHSFVLKV